MRAALLGGTLLVALALPGLGLADGPEGVNGSFLTVSPSDNLPSTATVAVSGTDFPTNSEVDIVQCSVSYCDGGVTVMSDSSGAFDLSFTVNRIVGGVEDCAYVSCYLGAYPGGYAADSAEHHLTFASPPDTDAPDTDPPETRITKDPPRKIEVNRAKFKFRSDEPGSSFKCKLDKRRWKPCSSPKTVRRLDEGRHKFRVRATDAAGNTDPTPAKDRFRVVD